MSAPAYEWLALLTLLGLPLWGAITGAFLSGAFVPRYALPWVLGFAALAAYSIACMIRHASLTVTIVMAVFVGGCRRRKPRRHDCWRTRLLRSR